MTQGYLVGPTLLGDIRRTIASVDNQQLALKPTRIETRFEEIQYPQQKIFRIGTFTGAWTLNGTNVVTLKVSGSTSATTVSATNLFTSLTNSTATATTMQCGISKDGTAWFLTSWPDTTSSIRMGTFTGTWSLNATNKVTFRTASTPNTVTATNLFASIGTASSSRNCGIAKDGTAWYLIAAQCG